MKYNLYVKFCLISNNLFNEWYSNKMIINENFNYSLIKTKHIKDLKLHFSNKIWKI